VCADRKQVPHRAFSPVRNDRGLKERKGEEKNEHPRCERLRFLRMTIQVRVKIKVKGDGQECPSHKGNGHTGEKQIPFGFAQGRLSPGLQPGSE